jgi:hypothetical protein
MSQDSQSASASIDASEIAPGDEFETLSELVDTERARQIYRRREKISTVLEDGDALMLEYDAARRDIDLILENRVRAYVLELGPLMRQAREDGIVTVDYWASYPEVVERFDPPARATIPTGAETFDVDEPQPYVVDLVGCKSLVDVQSPFVLSWQTVDAGSYTSAPEPSVIEERRQLSRDTLFAVLQACDEFRRELGLDISLKGGEIDVDDINPF